MFMFLLHLPHCLLLGSYLIYEHGLYTLRHQLTSVVIFTADKEEIVKIQKNVKSTEGVRPLLSPG